MFEKSQGLEEAAPGIKGDPIQTPAQKSNDKPVTVTKGWADCSKKQKAVDSPSTATLIISRNKYDVSFKRVSGFSHSAQI